MPTSKVPILMHKHTTDLSVGELAEELRIPIENDLIVLLIESHTCSGHVNGGNLGDVPRELREERNVLEKRNEMSIEIEVRFATL